MNEADLPEWLPPMLIVIPWHNGTYDDLYAAFQRDLLRGRLSYLGCNVWFYPDTEEEGRETIFWHLTTRYDKTQIPPVRLPDVRRCERLNWIKPMILRCPCMMGDVWDWDYEEGDGAIKTYVWLHRHDFVVIMKKLADGRRRLITSYHLDNEHERRKMAKKRDRQLPRTTKNERPPQSGSPTPSTFGG